MHAVRTFNAAALAMATAAALLAGACKRGEKKEKGAEEQPAAEVAGLDAIPASARVVLGFDVPHLARSPLVERAVRQMFVRDPELKQRFERLVLECEVDPATDLKSVLIGMGEGREQVLLVASGGFEEGRIAACVGRQAGAGGGQLTTVQVGGRTGYKIEEQGGRRPIYFAFGNRETLLVASSKGWLEEALHPGDSVRAAPELARLIGLASKRAGIWAAGFVPEEVGAGLLASAGGRLGTPPRFLFGQLSVAGGIEAELGAEMNSEDEAKSLVLFAKPQMQAIALVAQRHGLGPLVHKTRVDAEGKVVYLRLSLSAEEVRQLAARIDTEAGELQDSDLPDREGATDDVQGDAPPDDEAPVRHER